MSELIEKQWGWSEPVEDSMTCEVHRIDVVHGGFCSWHMHREKTNVFIAVRGRLVIEQRNEHGDIEQRVLRPGDSYSVPSKVVHRFMAPFESALAFEVYYATANKDTGLPRLGPWIVKDDIVRYSEGGRNCYSTS